MRCVLASKRPLAWATRASSASPLTSWRPPRWSGSSRLLAVVRIASITFSEFESTRPDSRKPAASAACSSRFAASTSRHCTCRIAGSSLKQTSGGGASDEPPSAASAAIAARPASSCACTSAAVTVRCSTSSHREPRKPRCGFGDVATRAARPEHVDVVT